MKKALIYGLSAALLLASLTACGKSEADRQTTEPEPAPQTDQIEPTQPEQPAQPAPQDPEPIADVQTIAEPEPIAAVEPEPEPTPENPLTFTDCNETVYATSQVNLRNGPSTEYDKVGSLSTGNSVTRTGIGTGDFENWSRVQLGDGSIVYVSSNYISTTKPATQQTAAKPSSSTQSKGNTQTNGNNGQTGTPSGGGASNNNGGEAGGKEFIESLGMGSSGFAPITDGTGGMHHNPDA